MAATTVRRNNFGGVGLGSSTVQTQTLPSPSLAGINGSSQSYPAPVTSTNASRLAAMRPTYAAPARTAGDSWSVQRDGERTVIVIEDTPPPALFSSKTAVAMPSAPNGTSLDYNTKRTKYNGASAKSANASYPELAVNNLTAPGPSNYASLPDGVKSISSKKASGSKRKYNEVNDPATAVRRILLLLA